MATYKGTQQTKEMRTEGPGILSSNDVSRKMSYLGGHVSEAGRCKKWKDIEAKAA
jgi:hypothetical protein